MKAAKITLLTILVLIAAGTTAAAQTQVFVPGTATGFFGGPNPDIQVPLVPAITVSGPSWITVTYVSGTVTDCCGVNTGPDGVPWPKGAEQFPLQEAVGVAIEKVKNMDALIGVFVPQKTVQRKGFSALDGTKAVTHVGIMPNGLFFIGTGKTFRVTEAGTLFLGINDIWVGDNGGGFTVTVAAQ